MKIIVDSREKCPLEFKLGEIIKEVEVRGMPFGDYWGQSEDGREYPVVYERKSLGDLFGTLSAGMERFKRSLERASKVDCQLYLLIEGSLETVLKGYEHSQVSGEQIVRTIFSLKVRRGLEPIFCANRAEMKQHIVQTYLAIDRMWKKEEGNQ